ncbi:hypothetical protein SDC9_182869 [bioreactor metagenome]|uniref:Uncharacterized protein n=1 Tax=bioreactor metagenome TaxID=1076179 RepID=A0A645H8K8_9ZZZZ
MSNKFKLALSRFSVENTAGLTIDNLGEWRKIVRNVAVSITNSKEAYAAWARCWLIFCANEKFVLSDLEVMQMIDQIYEVVHFVPSPEALNAITDKINGINACDWNTETKVFFLATGLELLQLFDKN